MVVAVADDISGLDHGEVGTDAAAAEAAKGGYGNNERSEAREDDKDRPRADAVAAAKLAL